MIIWEWVVSIAVTLIWGGMVLWVARWIDKRIERNVRRG